MTMTKRLGTKKVLQALVRGMDPETGQELPNDTVLQRVDVIRALIASIGAVEETEARALRRAQLPARVGNYWTEEEDQKLTKAFQEGQTTELVASSHGRTIRAIEARLERLGLTTAAQRTTNDSFMPQPQSPSTR
jgi:hypothetical protein